MAMDSTRSDEIKGYACAVLAAFMWASCGTVGKDLFEGGMTPYELVQVRVTLSAALLLVCFWLKDPHLLWIRRKDLAYFILLGGGAMAAMQISYFYAISKIHVAAAILLQYLAPILVAVFAVCFWRERLTVSKIAALILAFGGCYLVVGGYNLDLLKMNRRGILGGLGAAVSFASYSLLGEKGMHRYSPWTVLFYALAFSAATWHILMPPFHYLSAGFTPSQWGWLVYIAVVGTILPFGFYYVGINYIRSTRAIITATLEPIAAGFMAFFLLGETMEALQISGGFLVIGAIVILQVQQERCEMAPSRIRKRPA